MITEIRPGFFQAQLPNGVTCSFQSPSREAAERYVAELLSRLEKRQGRSLNPIQWRAKK